MLKPMIRNITKTRKSILVAIIVLSILDLIFYFESKHSYFLELLFGNVVVLYSIFYQLKAKKVTELNRFTFFLLACLIVLMYRLVIFKLQNLYELLDITLFAVVIIFGLIKWIKLKLN